MAIPIVWALQTVGGRQETNNGSRLVNFFAINTQDPNLSKSSIVLYSTPGFRKLLEVSKLEVNSSPVGSGIQGMISIDSPTYGRRLYGISAGYQFFEAIEGTHVVNRYNPYLDASGNPVAQPALSQLTSVRNFTTASVERFTGPARLVSDGRRIVFVVGRSVVMWDMEAGAFQQVYAPVANNNSATLPDEEWVDLLWFQGYFVLLARNGQIFHSNVHSDTFSQLDFATAERNPDPGVGIAGYAGKIYIFGSRTIESFYNAGTDPFAFRRDLGWAIPIGCAARDTLITNEAGMFFLGTDKMVYAFSGGGPPVRISNATVEYDIALSETYRAWGYEYTEEGRRFYSLVLTFPDGTRKNWTLDLVTGFWHERIATDILCATRWLDFNIIGREGSNYIYNQSLNWGDEDGTIVERLAISPDAEANLLVLSFRSLFLDQPLLPLPAGVADHGQLILDWRDDETIGWKPVVPRGSENNLKHKILRFNQLGSTKSGRNFRIRIKSGRRVHLDGAYIIADRLVGYGL